MPLPSENHDAQPDELAARAALHAALKDLGETEGAERRASRAESILSALESSARTNSLVPALGSLLIAWATIPTRILKLGVDDAETDKTCVWGVGEAKRGFTKVVAAARRQPQLIADRRSPTRATTVLVEANIIEGMVEALEKLALPEYATGAEMAEQLAHDGEPSRMAALPRRPTRTARRRLPTGGEPAPDPELQPRRKRAGG